MPLTPNHSIYYPDSQMNITPLESHFAALATSVEAALRGLPRAGSSALPSRTYPAGGVVSSVATISFPTPFEEPPEVMLSLSGSAYTGFLTAVPSAVTAHGFTVSITNAYSSALTGAYTLRWIAALPDEES